MDFRNFRDAILQKKNDDFNGITFVGRYEDRYLSYSEIFNKAEGLLNIFINMGIKKESEIIFQIDEPYEFVITFWASVLGGYIPVPVSVGNNYEHRLKLIKIWNTLNNPFLVTNNEIKEKILEFTLENNFNYENESIKNNFLIFNYEKIDKVEKRLYLDSIEVNEEDIVFIQFSSGSTGNPKGVTVTHQSLIENIDSIIIGGNVTKNDNFLSWMPLTHDMGLIGLHLTPVLIGINHSLMSTNLFIRKPLMWMDKISKYKITVTASPNFGYKHYLNSCYKKDDINVNLSNLRLIVNGAEPISMSLVNEFMDELSKYSLKRTAMFPVYGLAEATLACTFPPINEIAKSVTIDRRFLAERDRIKEVENGLDVVDLGYPLKCNELRIVDSNNEKLNSEHIGIVKIRGKNVTKGYYKNSEETKKIIQNDGWLNTGDIGFLKEGRLYLTGRKKDIIFVNGQNYYSHDLERMVHDIEGADFGKVVFVGIFDDKKGYETLVAFLYFKKKDPSDFYSISREISNRINKLVGVNVKEVIAVNNIPKTTSGKVRRFVLKDNYLENVFADNFMYNGVVKSDSKPKAQLKFDSINRIDSNELLEVQNILKDEIRKLLEIGNINIDENAAFSELGLDSLKTEQLVDKLEKTFKREVLANVFWDYPSINELSKYLINENYGNSPKDKESQEYSNNPIAIIGIGIRLPKGIDNEKDFFNALLEGKDFIEEMPLKRKKLTNLKERKGVRKAGYIEDIDMFDSMFFSISKKEAILMDPQQRLLLEVTYNALENANIAPNDLSGTNTGVFVGASTSDYSHLVLQNEETPSVFASTGNAHSILANRISYIFNLRGSSMAIDTACSSSLVAVHNAVESLKKGESSLAIAGGVNLVLLDKITESFSKAQMLSKDFKCKTFDKDADGYVRGEGCAVIVLKRRAEAIKDKDNIIAVINSTAINQDGKSNGLTAPNGLSQKNVIEKAIRKSSIESENIKYFESHGTGTKLGDPIELNTINDVFKDRKSEVYIGTLKSNIGHLEAAAGIMGLIKAALVAKERVIPKNINYNQLNPYININKDKIKLPLENIYLNNEKKVATCVSSYGFGGTNAHVVLSNYDDEIPEVGIKKKMTRKIIFISAKREEDIKKYIKKYVSYLKSTQDNLCDISYSSIVGRAHYKYRYSVSGVDKTECINNILKDLELSNEVVRDYNKEINIGAFLTEVSIKDSKCINLLFDRDVVFKDNVIKLIDLTKSYTDFSLQEFKNGQFKSKDVIKEDLYSFVFHYSLIKSLHEIGIKPKIYLGLGVGNIVAKCLNNQISVEDSLKLVYSRSLLLKKVNNEYTKLIWIVKDIELINSVLELSVKLKFDITTLGKDSYIINTKTSVLDNIIEKILRTESIFYIYPIEFNKDNLRGELGKLNDTDLDEFQKELIINSLDYYTVFKTLTEADNYKNNIWIEISSNENRVVLNDFINKRLFSVITEDSTGRANIIGLIKELYNIGFNFKWHNLTELFEAGKKVGLPTYPFKKDSIWIEFKDEKNINKSGLIQGIEAKTMNIENNNLNNMIELFKTQSNLIIEQTEILKKITGLGSNVLEDYNFSTQKNDNLEIENDFAKEDKIFNSEENKLDKVEFNVFKDKLLNIISRITAYSVDDIKHDTNLSYDLGFDSIMLSDFKASLLKEYPLLKEDIPNLLERIYNEEPNIQDLINILLESMRKRYNVKDTNQASENIEGNEEDFYRNMEEISLELAITSISNNQSIQYRIEDFEEYKYLENRLNEAKENNPYFKVNNGLPRDTMNVNGKEMINFSTYNYLGYNGEKFISDYAKEAVEKYGTSVSGSRLLSGEIPLHKELENEISEFLGTQDSIVFIGGYSTNVSVISHIVGEGDLIIHDSLSHNSIIQGALMSNARRRPFNHNDYVDLDNILTKIRDNYRRVLIVVEGLYSMDGDIVKLPNFIDIKKKHKCMLMVDEAHSLGTIGEYGAGVGEHFNIDRNDVDIWMGTLSKSLASCGGYISGDKKLVKYLKYTAPGFLFSCGITPPNTAASIMALKDMKENNSRVLKLRENSAYFLELAKEIGLDTGLSENTPIIPIITGDSDKCMKLSNNLLKKNINAMPIIYPAVEESGARLRFFVSNLHTKKQIETTIQTLFAELQKLD